MKYILYATNKNGDGYTTEVGTYDDLYDIKIRVGMFNKDVVISIETEPEYGDK